MRKPRWLLTSLLVAGSATHAAAPAIGAEDASKGPSWSEFRKLESEVKEQRQLIIQLVQTEQQRFDTLIKLLQQNGSLSGAERPNMPAANDGDKRAVASAPSKSSDGGGNSKISFIEGKINVPGGDTSDIYVYVDGIKTAAVKGKAVQIKQENKQFIPRLAVVQVGTAVTFPNLDPIFHNVFSNSPGNTFDLGSYRAGDKTRSVVMTKPGVVDIFCNMHQRMSANVLVVPSRLYAKVRPDGSFRIDGVPVGTRNLVAWSPSVKPEQMKVDVTPDGGRATFALEYTDKKTHTNKFGQPYGSYKE